MTHHSLLSTDPTHPSSLSPDVSIAQHYPSSPRLAEKLSRILAGLRKSVQRQKEQSK